MSLLNPIPDGLKPQEVERGNGKTIPPIPFIPEKLDEAVNVNRKPHTLKIELTNGVESRVDVWDGIGTKEQYLCHMMMMVESLQGMGLFEDAKEAEKHVSEAKENIEKAKEVLSFGRKLNYKRLMLRTLNRPYRTPNLPT